MPTLLRSDRAGHTAPLLDLVPERFPLTGVAVLGVAAGLCALVAGVVLGSWIVPLAVLAGLAAIPVVIREPAWAALLLVFLELSGVNDVIGSVGGVSPHLAGLGLATLAVLVGWRRGSVRPFWSPLFLVYVVFVAVQGATYVSATDRSLAIGAAFDGVRTLVFLVLLTWIMASRGWVTRIAAVAVACIAALSLLSVVGQYVFGNSTTFFGFSGVTVVDLGGATQRHTGPLPDSNFWARQIVMFIPLALSLWTLRRFKSLRWVWLAAAGVCMVGVYLSGSRGGLLAMGVAVVTWFLCAGRKYRMLLLLAPLTAVVVLMIPGLGSRLSTVTQVGTALAGEQADPSIEGRVAALKAGINMIKEHPLLGVGAGNFETVEPDYLRRFGIVSEKTWAPHNLYLQMAAEGGVLGLLAWLAFYAGALVTALRAWWRAGSALPRRFASRDAMLALGVWVGLLAWAIASFFLHLSQVRAVLVVVAIGLALERRVTAATAGLPATASLKRRRWQLLFVARPWRVTLAVALLVVCSGAGYVAASGLAPLARSEVSVVITPRTQENSYELDLLSRGQVPATYASIMAEPKVLAQARMAAGLDEGVADDYTVQVQLPRQSTVIQIGVTGPDGERALMYAGAIAARATAVVESLGTTFVLEPVAHSARVTSTPDPRGLWMILGGVVTGLALAAIVLLRSLPAGIHVLLGGRRDREPEAATADHAKVDA